MAEFTFRGSSSRDFYMAVERRPVLRGAVRRMTGVPIPGRHGQIHIDEGVYEHYTQPYDCYFHAPDATAPAQAHKVKAWLLGGSGYGRLIDDYDPDHFRLAVCTGPVDVANRLNRYGRCTVTFDCDPRAYLLSGQEPLELTGDGLVENPTAFPAEPLVRVFGSGAGTVSIGGTTVIIHDMTDELILDCERMDAYRRLGEGAPENRNGSIKAPVFPKLAPGLNDVSFTGGVTRLEITPRWWEL